MSMYNNIEIDFVERTCQNLKHIEHLNFDEHKLFEVTFFLNHCYGLLIFPQSKIMKVVKKMRQDLSYYGINEDNVVTTHDKYFATVIRSMRNGLSHGHIEFLSENTDNTITHIVIKDKRTEKAEPHTKITLSVEEFEEFVKRFAKEYLKVKKKNVSQNSIETSNTISL